MRIKKQKLCCNPDIKPAQPLKKNFHNDLAALAKAISHPIRIQILETLKSRKNCICGEIVAGLPLAQATVSQHLKVLKQAGFIRGEVSGPKMCYCLEPKTIQSLQTLVGRL